MLILNKIDTVKRDSLLALAADLNARVGFEATFMVSALNGSGTGDLLAHLGSRVPEGPGSILRISSRTCRCACWRPRSPAKVFLRLHDELPYSSTVETDRWKDQKDGSARIEQTIFVERESQRKIVLGKGGETVKAISMASRKEIGEIIERPVHPVPARQGARELGRRSRALPGDRARVPRS